VPDYAIYIMTVPAKKPRFSPEEYLRLETAAQDRHEYHAGEILAMSGGTYPHSRICANLIGETRQRLKGSPCFVLERNMRVRLAEADRYVYPDGTIICEEPQFDPRDVHRTTIINPKVVMEVLSDSTEAYDRGAKFSAYRDLESLNEYVLVSQNQPVVESFVRQPEGTWLFSAWRGVEATAALRSVRVDLPLIEIYAGLTFDDVPPV
jgi:Uma2 family endonuclease